MKWPKCPITGRGPTSKPICSCVFCLKVRADAQKDFRKRHPEFVRRMNLKKYSITPEEFDAKSAEQGDTCAVCNRKELGHNQHGRMSMAVDHDHVTGKVRGLLCHRCNRALGLLRDSSDIVKALYEYRRMYE